MRNSASLAGSNSGGGDFLVQNNYHSPFAGDNINIWGDSLEEA